MFFLAIITSPVLPSLVIRKTPFKEKNLYYSGTAGGGWAGLDNNLDNFRPILTICNPGLTKQVTCRSEIPQKEIYHIFPSDLDF